VSIDKRTPVGFIGTGIMGAHMAGHILAAGHPLHVFNRTRSRADDLVARGARWHDSPGAVAAECDVVITIVGYPADVEAVYLGAGGIVERAKPGAILVDMTTSSPVLAERIAQAAAARGVAALDAPVSGGDVGARNAKLSIMVGGDAAAFERALPVLRCMGENIVLQGGPGAGQHTKMCNQIVIGSTIMGVAEGIAYARRAGLDPKTVMKAIGAGAARSFQLEVLGAKMIDRDYAPGFMIEHLIKDLSIGIAEGERLGLSLTGAAESKRRFEALAVGGAAREGTQAIVKSYDPE
jgi:3-hydroxyisobutyrate dehydrogenase